MSEGSRSEAHSAPSGQRANVPAALRKKRGDRYQDGGRGQASQLPRSKSLSDLALEPIPQESDSNTLYDASRSWQSTAGEVVLEPSATDQVRPKHLHHIKTRVKDSEARWQDDLDRWKNRRLSANLDLWKKKEEREQLELMSSSGGADGLRTAVRRGVEEEGDPNDVLVFTTCQQQQAGAQEPSPAPQSSSRAPPSSQPSAPTSDKAFPASEASPLSTGCSMPGPMSSAGAGAVGTPLVDPFSTPVAPPTSGATSLTNGGDPTQVTPNVFFSPTESNAGEPFSPPEGAEQAGQRAKSLEGFSSGGARMSATLPRGFRRSEGGSRLSTGVTPRPFGAKASRVSSLPRMYAMDESHNSLVKGQRERPQLPVSFTSQEKDVTPTNDGKTYSTTQNGSHRKQKENKERNKENKENHSAPKVHSFMSASMVATSLKQRAVSESEDAKVGHTDMRVSLNQKPNSARDFGFQAFWDSTGARIKFVQPGSPAQLCHLLAGDEIVAVGGQRVAEMSYEQWKASMDAALKEGSLLMEIRRHGQNGHPEHCVAVSSSSSLPVGKVTEAKVNGHTVNGLSAKGVNRNFSDVPAVTKNKGGSESAISDLEVPSISASSSRWSWDTEEERRRQEKWQMEQERLLQEKYQRDQERLEEEWKRAQLDAAVEEYIDPEHQRPSTVSNGNTTPPTPPPFHHQSASSTVFSQRAAEVRPGQSRQVTMQIATSYQTKEECDSPVKTSQWSSESYGFAKLTTLDRKKSKSTPTLDSSHKQDSRAPVRVKKRGRLSQAEKDRQQILEEMRKKTQLHTDSSWIRQRSTCTIHKEPITVAPMRRYDSLDNLHSSSSLTKQFSTMSNPARPHSAIGNITPYRGYSGRCSLGPGAAIFSSTSRQGSWSRPSSTSSTPPVTPGAEETHFKHGRLVSGRRTCSRCHQPLGKGAAMVIDSLDLCFHIGCFKCISCRTDLGRGSESRAQVRVRHRQLFCDACYGRLRVRPGFPK